MQLSICHPVLLVVNFSTGPMSRFKFFESSYGARVKISNDEM